MTVAEYQQAQKDIAEIRGQIAQLRDVVAKGVPAMRGVYGLDQPDKEPLPEAGASYPNVGMLQFQQGKMMAGAELAKTAVTPFSTATEMIRGNPEEQGTIENIARGGAALIATAPAMLPLTVEQSVIGGIERGNPAAPTTDMAQAIGQTFQRQVTGEAGGVTRGEAWAKTPVEEAFNLATPLLAGLGISKARTPKFKSIKEARAAINDIGKPKVDVPEVVQEPIRSETPKQRVEPIYRDEMTPDALRADYDKSVESGNFEGSFEQYQKLVNRGGMETEITPKVDLSSEKPQPTTAQEVVETAKPLINQEAVPAKIQETQAINLDNLLGGKISQKAPIATKKRGASTYDGVGVGDIVVQNREGYTVKVDKLYENGKGEFTVIDAPDGHPWKNELNQGRTVRSSFHQPVTKNFTKLTPSDVPTTATEVVAKAKPNAVTKDVKALTPEELTAAQTRLREKFKPMDDVTKPQTPQTITEDLSQPVGDKVTPNAKAKEPWEMSKEEFAAKHPTVPNNVVNELGSIIVDDTYAGEGEWISGRGLSIKANKNTLLHEAGHAVDNILTDQQVKQWENIANNELPNGLWGNRIARHSKDTYYQWEDLYNSFNVFHKKYSGLPLTKSELSAISQHPRVFKFIADNLSNRTPEVLADYPELAAKYGKPTTTEAVVKKAGEKKDGKSKYYINQMEKDGTINFLEVEGKPITFKGYEDADLFIHKDQIMRSGKKVNGWVISEGRLGTRVTAGRTRAEAIDNVQQLLEETNGVTPERFNQQVAEKSKTWGFTPRHKPLEQPPPTELHSGVNPFKIIDDYMTKRKLVNPLGTPEHVLSGKGIVEPFRKAQEAIRNDTKLRGESLQETLKGIQRGSKEDTDLYHRLDDPKAVLNEQEQAVRNYLDDMLTEVNKHREARGQEPVKRRKGYITHLVEEVEKQSREYGDTPMPKRFRFQFELAREGNASHKVSAIEALEVYTKAALKDIYIGDALSETVPKIEAMGDRPLIFKKSVTSPDGKVTNMSFYQFSDAPIVTERGYAESFIKGQMNVPTVGQRILDKVFDIKPNTSSHAAMAVTARFYQSLLGLAVDSSVKNLTQGINTMAEMGVLPTLKGYAKLATAKGLKTAKAEHLLEDFNPLLMEGADLPFKTKTARTIGKGFSATMNAPMKVAEFINRGAAYHAAYDVYIKKGMSLEQAHEAARAAVRKTQFSYAKIDTSPALRGPFARTFSQFFSYPLKQSEMMYKWATKPGEQGKLVRYFLYTGMAVVGAKYGGVDLSGVFFDPIRMVDPNSKEGFQLPGTDKRVTFDASKLGKSGYTPQGFAPSISIPADFIKSQMSDDESAREYGRKKALTNIIPGGRYGKKVYDVITESDEKGKRDRLTRENTTKDKVLKLLGGKSTDREAESSRRETVNEVEKKYYATRQKLIDLKISGNEDEFIKLRDEFRDRYPFLYGRLMKGFGDAVKEERKKKGMTTDERFFDNSLRKQIDANL